jgi:hypothetical protein
LLGATDNLFTDKKTWMVGSSPDHDGLWYAMEILVKTRSARLDCRVKPGNDGLAV